ncbi:MAG: hypothetical protein WKF58_05870 [Ilumatobacteraceae bacterium]
MLVGRAEGERAGDTGDRTGHGAQPGPQRSLRAGMGESPAESGNDEDGDLDVEVPLVGTSRSTSACLLATRTANPDAAATTAVSIARPTFGLATGAPGGGDDAAG